MHFFFTKTWNKYLNCCRLPVVNLSEFNTYVLFNGLKIFATFIFVSAFLFPSSFYSFTWFSSLWSILNMEFFYYLKMLCKTTSQLLMLFLSESCLLLTIAYVNIYSNTCENFWRWFKQFRSIFLPKMQFRSTVSCFFINNSNFIQNTRMFA